MSELVSPALLSAAPAFETINHMRSVQPHSSLLSLTLKHFTKPSASEMSWEVGLCLLTGKESERQREIKQPGQGRKESRESEQNQGNLVLQTLTVTPCPSAPLSTS